MALGKSAACTFIAWSHPSLPKHWQQSARQTIILLIVTALNTSNLTYLQWSYSSQIK
jgi:hypothetical protein